MAALTISLPGEQAVYQGNKTITGTLTIGGQSLNADGVVAAPGISFASAPGMGIFKDASGWLGVAQGGGVENAAFTGVDFRVRNDTRIAWTSGTVQNGTDLLIGRDAANTLYQRNGVNPQEHRIYNTYTDAANYERLSIFWSSNVCRIRTQNAGTGAHRSLQFDGSSMVFQIGGVNKWSIGPNNLYAESDNAFDIGGSANTFRPRTGYFGTLLVAPSMYVQGTYTDASNYERLLIESNVANNFNIVTMAAGTGVARALTIGSEGNANLNFRTNGITSWQVTNVQQFRPVADNAYPIGTSALRPSNIYWGTQSLAPNGVVGTPAYSFASRVSAGLFVEAAGHMHLVNNGVKAATMPDNGASFIVGGALYIGGNAGQDTILDRISAGVLAQRNGTNYQEFRVYGSYTDASNYRGIALFGDFSGSSPGISAIGAGTGANRSLHLQAAAASGSKINFFSGASAMWQMYMDSGQFAPFTDNVYDIGLPAKRIRDLYVGRNAFLDGYQSLLEIATPGVAAANSARLFAKDNGAGKTQLAVIFASGAEQILATEP